ncbi:hypothetical protein HSX37_16315|uniref:Prophage antirepressor n=1 Tax=Dendrosporobacter quercicolus TaxID=146817 RepID=A0A1G9ZV69_9FIRM|nr:BRO family protein [Dendrosporobacter quercicolus]NSL49601.1 hypothetical protein [Dendrosporobacter quercicolus DSM 1736]SDN24446.1 Prophage antirepressor [Dendrosporobacter quercicolus]
MRQLKQIFEYQGQIVRTITQCSEPLFCGKDLCEILEIDSTQLRRLDDDEKVLRLTQTPGGEQEMVFVNEPGLYSLIIGSRKLEAKAFKRWITHEVLPTIRKTGKYSLYDNPNAILRRHLDTATKLSKGLSKPQQLELRRLAVMDAAEESGADYSAILAVLEAPEVQGKALHHDLDRDVDLFLQDVARRVNRYHVQGNYLILPPSEERRICERLDIDRTALLRELDERGMLRVAYGWNNGIHKKNYTHHSTFYGRKRCVHLKLNCINIQGE